MTLHTALFHRPSRLMRLIIWLLALGLVALFGYLRQQTMPVYEFHLLFLLPVILVAWFVSLRRAWVITALAVVVWYLAERTLGNDASARLPLLANSVQRFAMLLAAAWLLGRLRARSDRGQQPSPGESCAGSQG